MEKGPWVTTRPPLRSAVGNLLGTCTSKAWGAQNQLMPHWCLGAASLLAESRLMGLCKAGFCSQQFASLCLPMAQEWQIGKNNFCYKSPPFWRRIVPACCGWLPLSDTGTDQCFSDNFFLDLAFALGWSTTPSDSRSRGQKAGLAMGGKSSDERDEKPPALSVNPALHLLSRNYGELAAEQRRGLSTAIPTAFLNVMFVVLGRSWLALSSLSLTPSSWT